MVAHPVVAVAVVVVVVDWKLTMILTISVRMVETYLLLLRFDITNGSSVATQQKVVCCCQFCCCWMGVMMMIVVDVDEMMMMFSKSPLVIVVLRQEESVVKFLKKKKKMMMMSLSNNHHGSHLVNHCARFDIEYRRPGYRYCRHRHHDDVLQQIPIVVVNIVRMLTANHR